MHTHVCIYKQHVGIRKVSVYMYMNMQKHVESWGEGSQSCMASSSGSLRRRFTRGRVFSRLLAPVSGSCQGSLKLPEVVPVGLSIQDVDMSSLVHPFISQASFLHLETFYNMGPLFLLVAPTEMRKMEIQNRKGCTATWC